MSPSKMQFCIVCKVNHSLLPKRIYFLAQNVSKSTAVGAKRAARIMYTLLLSRLFN